MTSEFKFFNFCQNVKMSTCSSSIVECLREIGIEPTTFASSEYSNSERASYALEYSTSNNFATKRENKPQYWAIDFKRIVTINSYQIKTQNLAEAFRKWKISTSFDNKTWTLATPINNGFPGDIKYQLNKAYSARYARVDAGCIADDQTFFWMYYIKFFGSLEGSKPANAANSCFIRKTIDANLLKMVFLMTMS